MVSRQQNNPNWFQAVSVYRPGESTPIEEFCIEQVWDGSIAGYRRLRNMCVQTVEALRDKTGLEYIMWSPTCYGGVEIPRQDRQSVAVS